MEQESNKHSIAVVTIMRMLGAANIVFWFSGLLYFTYALKLHQYHWPGSPSSDEWAVFCVIALTSLSLSTYSAWIGFRLLRSDRSVMFRASLLYILQIVWAILVGLSWSLVSAGTPRMQIIIAAFWTIAWSRFVPLTFYYPVVGVALLVILQGYNKWRKFSNRRIRLESS